MKSLGLLSLLIGLITCITLNTNENYYVPLSCGTSTTNGCEYNFSVSSEELLNIYLMPFVNFVEYINNNRYGSALTYYSFFSKENVKEFSQTGNSSDEMVVLVIQCPPQNICNGGHFNNGCTNPRCNFEFSSYEEQLSKLTDLHDEIIEFDPTGSASIISVFLILMSILLL